MQPQPLLKEIILKKIHDNGGWVNAHAHFDRAFSVHEANLRLAHQLMEKKWTLVDDLKRTSSEEDYYARIEKSIQLLIRQGVTATCTFIDVDAHTELRAIKAAISVKQKYKQQITIKLINQVLTGVMDPESKKWAEKSLEYIDIIGGLPSRDRPQDAQHIDTIFSWAKETGKMVHVHIDQENNPDEHDTEMLARKTIDFGLQGKVVAVHAVSIAAQPKQAREHIYALLKDAGIIVVCCPSAALSMNQLPKETPLHNSIVPVGDLLDHTIPVALGTDNISDIYQPLVDGDMFTELRMLAEACRFYNIEQLVNIATTNGRMALGL